MKFKTEEERQALSQAEMEHSQLQNTVDTEAEAHANPLLFQPSYRPMITTLVHNIIMHLEVVHAEEADLLKRKKKSLKYSLTIGSIGLSCKFCKLNGAADLKGNPLGRFFVCSEAKTLAGNVRGNICRHLKKCALVPDSVKKRISASEGMHTTELRNLENTAVGGLSTYFGIVLKQLKAREVEFMAAMPGGAHRSRINAAVEFDQEESIEVTFDDRGLRADSSDDSFQLQDDNNDDAGDNLQQHSDEDYEIFPFHSEEDIELSQDALLPPDLRHHATHPYHAALLGQYVCKRATFPSKKHGNNRIGLLIWCRYCQRKIPYGIKKLTPELTFHKRPIYTREKFKDFYRNLMRLHTEDICENIPSSTQKCLQDAWDQMDERLERRGELFVFDAKKFNEANSTLDIVYDRLMKIAKLSLIDEIKAQKDKEEERKREAEKAAAAGAARARQEHQEEQERLEREAELMDHTTRAQAGILDDYDDAKPAAICSNGNFAKPTLRKAVPSCATGSALTSPVNDSLAQPVRPNVANSNPAIHLQQPRNHREGQCLKQRKQQQAIMQPTPVKSAYTGGPSIVKPPNPFKDAKPPGQVKSNEHPLVMLTATASFQNSHQSSSVPAMLALTSTTSSSNKKQLSDEMSKAMKRNNDAAIEAFEEENLSQPFDHSFDSSAAEELKEFLPVEGQSNGVEGACDEKLSAKVDDFTIPKQIPAGAVLDQFSIPKKKQKTKHMAKIQPFASLASPQKKSSDQGNHRKSLLSDDNPKYAKKSKASSGQISSMPIPKKIALKDGPDNSSPNHGQGNRKKIPAADADVVALLSDSDDDVVIIDSHSLSKKDSSANLPPTQHSVLPRIAPPRFVIAAPASLAPYKNVPKPRCQRACLAIGRDKFRPERYKESGEIVRCENFFHNRICLDGDGNQCHGNKCPRPHEFKRFYHQGKVIPLHQTPNDWRTVHNIYEKVLGRALEKDDFKVMEREAINGLTYFTCMLVCPCFGVLYYAEDCGSNGAAISGGLHWYGSRSKARKAAATVALSHLRSQGHEERLLDENGKLNKRHK